MHVIPATAIFHGTSYEGKTNWGQVFNHLSLILAYLRVNIEGQKLNQGTSYTNFNTD